jgi:LCP family protein required for cell wall assembly
VNEWPAGWYRDEKPQPAAAGGSSEPTVQLPGGGGAAGGQPHGGWPSQPPRYRGSPPPFGSAAPPPVYAPGPPRGLRRPRGGRRGWGPRRVFGILAVVVAALLIISVGVYFYLDGQLVRKNVLVNYAGRPAAGAGQNWLITGSDSRQGLTKAQERKLATGFDVSGQRSDTIMVLHIPANGLPAVLVSLPRDSYVPIPGNGYNKINAAYSFGGPKLLAQTVETVTGLHIDHYMGIGFGGLVNAVNAVGGVRMCLPHAMTDPAAGLHLKAGCQTLDGAEALGFVRSRHLFAGQDLQRIQDQRLFLSALLRKLTSPGTIINPFASLPAAFGTAGALTVDKGTHLYQLLEVAFALRHPETTTVPIANANYFTPAGDAVKWDTPNALKLFNDLRTDQPVPKSLLSGSTLG